MFVEFSEITNRLYVSDLRVLSLIFNNQLNDTSNRNDLYKIERLNSLGIIGLAPKTIFIGKTSSRQDSYVNMNNIGKVYAKIIWR